MIKGLMDTYAEARSMMVFAMEQADDEGIALALKDINKAQAVMRFLCVATGCAGLIAGFALGVLL